MPHSVSYPAISLWRTRAGKTRGQNHSFSAVPVEPNYTNYDLTGLEVISHSELIDRYFKGGKLMPR
jgi:hypothetical protein